MMFFFVFAELCEVKFDSITTIHDGKNKVCFVQIVMNVVFSTIKKKKKKKSSRLYLLMCRFPECGRRKKESCGWKCVFVIWQVSGLYSALGQFTLGGGGGRRITAFERPLVVVVMWNCSLVCMCWRLSFEVPEEADNENRHGNVK